MEILFLILFFPAFFLIFISPGLFLTQIFKLKLPLAEKITVAFFLSSAVSVFVYFIASFWFNLSFTTVWLIAIIENLIFWYWFYRTSSKKNLWRIFQNSKIDNFNQTQRKWLWLVAVIIGGLFLFSSLEYVDPNQNFHATTIGDNDKHFSMVVSLINSSGFPPEISASSIHNPVQINYYYFYYLLIAVLAKATAQLAPVTVLFAVFGALMLIAGCVLISLTGRSLFPNQSRMVFFSSLIPLLGGWQIIYLTNHYFKEGQLYPFISMFDDMGILPILNFPHLVNWVPQHLLGLFFILLIVYLFSAVANKLLLAIMTGFLLAVSIATSFFIFTSAIISFLIFAVYLFLQKDYRKLLIPAVIFFVSLLVILFFTYKFLAGNPNSNYIGDMVDILLRDPLAKNLIFGLELNSQDIGFWARIYWTFLYYLERLGFILPLGLIGLIVFRREILAKTSLALMTTLGLGALITTYTLALPGEQNEFAKYTAIFYILMLSYFSFALVNYLLDLYQKWQSQKNIKNNFWHHLHIFSLNLGWAALILGISLNIASGWWSYNFSMFKTKIKYSLDMPRSVMAGSFNWLRHKTKNSDIVAMKPEFANLAVSYGQKRILTNKRLGVFPVASQEQIDEVYSVADQLDRYFQNGFNQEANQFLADYQVKYLLISKLDQIYLEKDAKIDNQYFQPVYQDQNTVIYQVGK